MRIKLLWGCFSSPERGKLLAVDRKIDEAKYTANLEEDLFEAAKDLRL